MSNTSKKLVLTGANGERAEFDLSAMSFTPRQHEVVDKLITANCDPSALSPMDREILSELKIFIGHGTPGAEGNAVIANFDLKAVSIK